MMNAFDKSQQLQLTGTDQQIVDVLKTLTVSAIPVSLVGPWLRENKLWYRGADGAMKGSLVAIYAAANDAMKEKMDILHAAVFGGGAQVIRTNEKEWAMLAWDLISAIVVADPSKAALIDSFYALDGGRPYKDLTAQQYATQKTQAETAAADAEVLAIVDQAWSTVENEVINPAVASSHRTKASIAAALRTAASQLEA